MPTMTIKMPRYDIKTHCTRLGRHWFVDEDIRGGEPIEGAIPFGYASPSEERRRPMTDEEVRDRVKQKAATALSLMSKADRERVSNALHQALWNECSKRGGTAMRMPDGMIRVDTTIDPGEIIFAVLSALPI